MAGTYYGADVAQLRALAGQFDAAADRLEDHRTGIGIMVGQSPWFGPDASHFSHTWDAQHAPRIAQAVAILRDASQRLRRNADGQEQVSAVAGTPGVSGWPSDLDSLRKMPYPIGPRFDRPNSFGSGGDRFTDSLDWIEEFKNQRIADTGFSISDVFGLIPKVGGASDVLGAADKICHGEFPWHEGADIVGGALRGSGTPLGYGLGLNISLWSDVVEQGSQVDWSWKGMQDAWNGAMTLDGWNAVGKDMLEKLPPILLGDFAL